MLRLQDDKVHEFFGLPALDRLVRIVIGARRSPTKTTPALPVVELTSTTVGGGKTHLIYHLTALAVLPNHFGGKCACVVIIDTDGSFSVPRLARQIRLLATNHTTQAPSDLEDPLFTALKHVHIFRPQSLASTITTIESLSDYLFNSARHHSTDRQLGFLALDSASAFYWQAKADEQDALLLAPTSPGTGSESSARPPGYARLANALGSVGTTFYCPVIFTSWHFTPVPVVSDHQTSMEGRALRPSHPMHFSQSPLLRLIVRPVPVRKFPARISLEEALQERGDRQKAVEEGRFECVVNEWGVDGRTLQKIQGTGNGFGFRIKDAGVFVDQD